MWFCVSVILWLTFSLSGYDNSTGAWPYQGMTASGRYADATTIACGSGFPLGTRFLIDGALKVCWDRGPAISDKHIDVWMPTYAQALALGRRELRVGGVREGCR